MDNMKKFGNKALAILLCVCMVFSCMTVTASAADPATVVSAFVQIVSSAQAVATWAKAQELTSADEAISAVFQDVTGRTHNYQLAVPSKLVRSYSQVLKINLNCIASDWNANFHDYGGISWTVRTALTKINGVDCWVLALSVPRSAFVNETGYDTWFLCDGFGNVLYATADDTAQDVGGEFVSIQKLKSPYRIVGYDALCLIAERVGGYVRKSDGYYFIYNSTGTRVWYSSDGMAYAALVNDDEHAINQERPTTSGTVTEGGNTTNITNENNDYSQNIDIENMTQVLPGGQLNQIENLIYDANTKTYYVDSFNTTNNSFDFSFYEYHINYTSITYIGQTVEYEKHYELYYQLPDGRDSADLTASDLEQISTSFKDVMNYARSADDLNQRVLYHFDGNTEDSSYWSYCTDFHWNEGASLTYMDEGVFGGALYLDETPHAFTINFPSNDAVGDWTIQFRFYQSYSLTPVWDTRLYIGGQLLLALDGQNYGDSVGFGRPFPCGTWNELCLMRKDGIVYYYLNGVCVNSRSVSIPYSDLYFYFGDQQQTYKKIDELRFTRGAIYTPGQNYTPTSVPYDSNLTLVLPDSRIPVADEVMVLNPSANNLFDNTGFSDWSGPDFSSYPQMVPVGGYTSLDFSSEDFGKLYVNPSYTGLITSDGLKRFWCTSGMLTEQKNVDETYHSWTNTELRDGLFLPVCGYWIINDWRVDASFCVYTPGVPYTLSVVLADGSSSYCTFVVHQIDFKEYALEIISSVYSSDFRFSVVDLAKYGGDHPDDPDPADWVVHRYGIDVYAPPGAAYEILYMELVEGSSPQFSITYEGATYDPIQLTDSPILAVRSNLPITTYQIGGVRPSYPQKGQVYAMVERGYITSLQQYTGSAWEAVDGRIWTGSRWIPASSYNVITLQDMYDIVDATPDYEYIYSESGFWDWFQRAWKDLLVKLDAIIEGQKGSGGSAGSVSDEVLPPAVDDTEDGWGAYDLLVVIKDGTWSFITGVISTGFNGLVGLANGMTHITGFFDSYRSGSPISVIGITNYGGADIWD